MSTFTTQETRSARTLWVCKNDATRMPTRTGTVAEKALAKMQIVVWPVDPNGVILPDRDYRDEDGDFRHIYFATMIANVMAPIRRDTTELGARRNMFELNLSQLIASGQTSQVSKRDPNISLFWFQFERQFIFLCITRSFSSLTSRREFP